MLGWQPKQLDLVGCCLWKDRIHALVEGFLADVPLHCFILSAGNGVRR